MSELVPTKKRPREVGPRDPRGPEGCGADATRRSLARSNDGLAAQEAARAPGRQPREAGVGVGGVARLLSGHPRVQGRAAVALAAELAELVTLYQDHAANTLARVADHRESVQRLHRRDVFGTAREAIERVVARDGAWAALEQEVRRLAARFDAAAAQGDSVATLGVKAGLAKAAIAAFDQASMRVIALGSELHRAHEEVGVKALEVSRVASTVADVAFVAAIAAGALYFAPTLAPALAPGVAPSTVGGTAAGASKAMVLGATLRGVGEMAGAVVAGAVGGDLDVDSVGAAAGRGIRHGAVDGLMGQAGGAARGLLSPLVAGAGGASGAAVRMLGGAALGAATGAAGEATKARLDGANDDELAGRTALGAGAGATLGALHGL